MKITKSLLFRTTLFCSLVALICSGSFAENSLLTQIQSLHQETQDLLRRARHPDAPGSPGLKPGLEDLQSIESRFLNWKKELEGLIETIPADSNYLARHDAITEQNKLILRFLEELKAIASLRFALRAPGGPEWQDSLSLTLPESRPQTFFELNKIQNHWQIEKSKDSSRVYLKLSAGFLLGLETGELAITPNEEDHFTALQFLVTNHLHNLLARVHFLLADEKETRAAPPPVRLPNKLLSKMRSLEGLPTFYQEETLEKELLLFKNAVFSSLPKLQPRLPPFIAQEFVEKYTRILFLKRETQRTAAPLINKLLGEAESAFFGLLSKTPPTNEAEEAIQGSVINDIHRLLSAPDLPSDSALLRRLSALVANYLSALQLQGFTTLTKNNTLVATPEQHRKVINWILEWKDTYQVALEESDSMRAWLQELREESQKPLLQVRDKKLLINNLVRHSTLAFQLERKIYPEERVDMGLLFLCFGEEIETLKPRGSLQPVLSGLAGDENFAAAKKRYVEFFKKEQIPVRRTAEGESVNPEFIRFFIEKTGFNIPEIEDPKLRSRLIEGRKKDALDLLQVGEWLGFHRSGLPQDPSIQQILSQKNLNSYFDLYKKQILSLYPLLELKVTVQDIRTFFGKTKLPLYRAVAQAFILQQYTGQNPAPSLDDLLNSWGNEALTQVQGQTLKNIASVGNAKKPEDLDEIATSSVIQALMLKEFQAFGRHQQNFSKKILLPTTTEHFMHHYVGNGIFYTCLPVLAILLAKWGGGAGRWAIRRGVKRLVPKHWVTIQRFLGGTQGALRFFHSQSRFLLSARGLPRLPFFRGVMTAVLVPIVADTGYQFYRLYDLYEDWDSKRDFYYSSLWHQDSLFTQNEMAQADSALFWGTAQFSFRMALDTYFMWYPLAIGPALRRAFHAKTPTERALAEISGGALHGE